MSRAMVLAFGLDHIIISADRPKDPKASRYLENTASTRGKPSFTAEAGRSGPVDPADVAALVNGVQHVHDAPEDARGPAAPVARPVWIEKIVTVAADRDGMFWPRSIATRTSSKARRSASSPIICTVRCRTCSRRRAASIMFMRAVPSLKKGDTMVNIGVITEVN